jgi:hypothetical protein
VWLALAAVLSLATLPLTIIQLEALFGFGPRPVRLDYLVLLWAAIPWFWRHPSPFWWLRPSAWPSVRTSVGGTLGTWRARWRTDRSTATVVARRAVGERLRTFLGLGA